MLDRAAVRALRHGEQLTVREIARVLGVSRNAVRRALDPEATDTYRRRSRLEDLEPAVRDVLADHPFMPAPRVAELVGWTGSVRHLSDLVRRVREDVVARAETAAPIVTGRLAAIGACSTGTVAAAAQIEVGRTRW